MGSINLQSKQARSLRAYPLVHSRTLVLALYSSSSLYLVKENTRRMFLFYDKAFLGAPAKEC